MIIQNKIKSNAKINLALRITDRLENGYHTISTLFQEIDFYDDIIFTKSEKFGFTSNIADLPTDNSNLCIAAYEKMKNFQKNGQDFLIHLEKRIPMGAGLGGGSSNAATVLKFLNKNWEINFDDKELERIGFELGCDVPFFIKGGTQGGDGLGEILTPLSFPTNYVILLVHPQVHISTVWAYKNFSLTSIKNKYKFASLLNNNVINWQMFENVFENLVFQSYPEIGEIKQKLLQKSAVYSGLSGSGSTVVGIFDDKEKALSAMNSFENFPTQISLPVR